MKIAAYFIAAFFLLACSSDENGPTGVNTQVDTVGHFRELFSSGGKDDAHSHIHLIQVRWNAETGKADTTGERLTARDIHIDRYWLFSLAESTHGLFYRKGDCWFFDEWVKAGFDCFEADYDRNPKPGN